MLVPWQPVQVGKTSAIKRPVAPPPATMEDHVSSNQMSSMATYVPVPLATLEWTVRVTSMNVGTVSTLAYCSFSVTYSQVKLLFETFKYFLQILVSLEALVPTRMVPLSAPAPRTTLGINVNTALCVKHKLPVLRISPVLPR